MQINTAIFLIHFINGCHGTIKISYIDSLPETGEILYVVQFNNFPIIVPNLYPPSLYISLKLLPLECEFDAIVVFLYYLWLAS